MHDPEAAATAFGALSDPVRVAIVARLAEATVGSESPAVGFARLRRAVGVDDSGRFRYHLNELRDTFVERADDGYRLTVVGRNVAAVLATGAFDADVRVERTPFGDDCPQCGDALTAGYRNGIVRVGCGDHTVFAWTLPPNAVRDRSIDAVVDLAVRRFRHASSLATDGVCPECLGDAESRAVEMEAGARFTASCRDCSGRIDGRLADVVAVQSTLLADWSRTLLPWRLDVDRLDEPGDPIGDMSDDGPLPEFPSTRTPDEPTPNPNAVFARFAVTDDDCRLVARVGPTGRTLSTEIVSDSE